MPAFAPAALGTAVGLSALGAVVLCLLVILYGFTPADEDASRKAPHRLLLIRLGHAVAAACFAATAILISTVLARPAPVPAPMPAAVSPAEPDARVPELGERVTGQESRLSATEARLREIEEALRRHEAEQPRPAEKPAVSEPPVPAASPTPPRRSPAPAPAAAPSPPSPAQASPAPPPVSVSPRRSFDLPDKLREDWQEIQRGVDPAGDDFPSAIEGLRRRLLGH
jgi:hypothetical protein